MSSQTVTGPLSGVTVLDLTRVLSGPYCTMMLADMGARVIKIEQPGTGDDTRAWGPPFIEGESAYFLSVNRSKESVTLDFKKPEGLPVLKRLIARADVLVENFRPGALDRIGLDAKTLERDYPRLIHCSVSGFGQTGPRRDEAGYDAVMQAEGGLMSLTGSPEGPPYRVGVAVVDVLSGILAAHGVVLALYSRNGTDRGQRVDVAMLDSVVSLLTYQAGIYFATGVAPQRMGNRHPTIVPYETFEAADGEVVIAVGNNSLFRLFCSAIDLERLPDDERFKTNEQRVLHYDQLMPLLMARLGTATCQHWIERLRSVGVPCGAVRDLHAVLTDPQLHARGMIVSVDHPTIGSLNVIGNPIHLSDTAGSIRTGPPLLGQHTDAVLRHDLGLCAGEIERLRSSGAI